MAIRCSFSWVLLHPMDVYSLIHFGICSGFLFVSTLLLSVVAHKYYKQCLCQILRLIMSISCLSHFLEDPCSFYWRIVLETKILVLNVLIATGMFFLLNTLSWQSKEMCVYISLCIYMPFTTLLQFSSVQSLSRVRLFATP